MDGIICGKKEATGNIGIQRNLEQLLFLVK
jgi:hypothetical protein